MIQILLVVLVAALAFFFLGDEKQGTAPPRETAPLMQYGAEEKTRIETGLDAVDRARDTKAIMEQRTFGGD